MKLIFRHWKLYDSFRWFQNQKQYCFYNEKNTWWSAWCLVRSEMSSVSLCWAVKILKTFLRLNYWFGITVYGLHTVDKIIWLNHMLTLTRPLREKLWIRWFFDVSRVKESSFLNRISLTPSVFLRFLRKISIWPVPDFIFQWVLYQDHVFSQIVL